MRDGWIRIKYNEGYNSLIHDTLTDIAAALHGEFRDCPVADGAREMSFKFENGENLYKFFQFLKAVHAEKKQDQDNTAQS